jgi:hypothetical protein
MPRKSQKSMQQNLEKQAAIQQAVERFFGGVTKEEAHEVFRTLAVLAQFPGAVPPEPLNGCEIHWTSTLKIGDTLDKQIFGVTAIYKGLTFEYTANRNRVMQLPDGTFMNFEAWDYQELLLTNRCS